MSDCNHERVLRFPPGSNVLPEKEVVSAFSSELRCKCTNDPVTAAVTKQITHCHFCACPDCWRQAGEGLALIALVDSGGFEVTSGEEYLEQHDTTPTMHRHRCNRCKVDVYSESDNYGGLTFVAPELFVSGGWQLPTSAVLLKYLESKPEVIIQVMKDAADLGIPASWDFASGIRA